MTSYGKLSEETGLSVKEVRTALSKLVSTGEIKLNTPKHNKKGKAYTLITVCKYDEYQKIDPNRGTEGAQKGQREGTERAQEGQLLTINNKENKENNNNNNSADTIVYKDVADLLLEYKTRRVYTAVQENCKLTQEQLDRFLDDFNVHVTTRGRSTYNFDDYAVHFKNWLDIRIKNGGKDKNVKFLKKSRAL
jgi:DNA-binding Lrp family transcriptional regulator